MWSDVDKGNRNFERMLVFFYVFVRDGMFIYFEFLMFVVEFFGRLLGVCGCYW